MISKLHDAKQKRNIAVDLWGLGTPMREFLFVDDLAGTVVFALENKLSDNLYNIGTGRDLTIKALAGLIQSVVGHIGKVSWDSTKPDGAPRKLLDVPKMEEVGGRQR